jgi:hypothetical protein
VSLMLQQRRKEADVSGNNVNEAEYHDR